GGADVATLLPNGVFELVGAACAPWKIGQQGTLEWVAPGHDSPHACRACAKTAQSRFSIYAAGPSPLDAGLYRIGGWLRVASGNPPGVLRLYVDYGNDAGWQGGVY